MAGRVARQQEKTTPAVEEEKKDIPAEESLEEEMEIAPVQRQKRFRKKRSRRSQRMRKKRKSVLHRHTSSTTPHSISQAMCFRQMIRKCLQRGWKPGQQSG